jgi:hypothetical protein
MKVSVVKVTAQNTGLPSKDLDLATAMSAGYYMTPSISRMAGFDGSAGRIEI